MRQHSNKEKHIRATQPPFLVSDGKAQAKLPSFNSSREELGLIESFDGSGTLITSSGVTPVTILDIQDVEIVSL